MTPPPQTCDFPPQSGDYPRLSPTLPFHVLGKLNWQKFAFLPKTSYPAFRVAWAILFAHSSWNSRISPSSYLYITIYPHIRPDNQGTKSLDMASTRPSEKDQRPEFDDSASKGDFEHKSHNGSVRSVQGPSAASDDGLRQRHDASAKMANPLAGLSQEVVVRMAEEYCAQHGFTAEEDLRVFRLGAMIAGNSFQWDTVEGLTDTEKEALQKEVDHKWKANPMKLYGVIVVCVSNIFRIHYNKLLFQAIADGLASRHSALPSKVWTRPSLMVPSLSTRSLSELATQTPCVNLGLLDLLTAPLTSAVPSSDAGSPSP